jgi:hypothetical protein
LLGFVVPQLTWEETFSGLLAQSPQLAAAEAGVARAQAALRRECARPARKIEIRLKAEILDASLAGDIGQGENGAHGTREPDSCIVCKRSAPYGSRIHAVPASASSPTAF